MGVVDERVDGVGNQQGDGGNVHVLEGDFVVFLGLLLSLVELVLVFQHDPVREQGAWCGWAYADVDNGGDLPEFDKDAYDLGTENHPAGVLGVVQEIQENDSLHEDVGQDGAHGNTDIVLLLAVVSNVGTKGESLKNQMRN